jgi:lipopolysaccharide export system protein LptA
VNDSRILVRRASAAALGAWLLVLGVVFVQRQLRRAAPPAPVNISAPTSDDGERPLRVHRGFVFSDTLGVRPNFRLAAAETIEFPSGWIELRDVELWLYHEGEVAYGLVASRGRFHQGRREVRVTGSAQVSLQSGVVMRAESFAFQGAERILASEGTVAFAGSGWSGLAGGARVEVAADVLELGNGVSLTTRSAVEGASSSLLAPRVRYRRKDLVAEFPEGLTLLRGPFRFRAGRGEVTLVEPEGVPRRVAFQEGVDVEGRQATGAEIQLEAGGAVFEAIGPERWNVTAEAAEAGGWVRGRWREADGSWRELDTWRMIGEGSETAWEWLEGQGRACVEVVPPEGDPRFVESDTLRIAFENGQPATATARGSVVLSSGGSQAEGGEFVASLRGRRFTLLPEAGGRVTVDSEDGAVSSDRAEGEEGGQVAATGHVAGVSKRDRLWGDGQGAVNFAADAAQVGPEPGRFRLNGDARVWQGGRIVRADRITYDRGSQIVTGVGGVVSRDAGVKGTLGTVEIRARSLEYDRASGRAVYEGDVVLEESRATTRCQRLHATLGEAGEIREAVMSGGVDMHDRVAGRTLEGERARFIVAEDVVEVWGSPVLARERSGNQVKADHLALQRATGTVTVLGGESGPSETIYHPEKTPGPGKPAG